MTKALPALLSGGLVVLGVGLLVRNVQREIGRRDHALMVRESAIATLMREARHVDSIYVTDTIRLTKWKTAYDTTRDTLLKHLTDTLRVVEYIHIADSTIAACSQVVLTCQVKVEQRDSIIQQQASQLKILRTPPRRFGLIPAPSRTLVFGIGLVGGYLLHR